MESPSGLANGDESLFQESQIPNIFQGLDDAFRCQICSNLFDKAVSIKACGHTFCSLCIRSYFVTVRTGVHRQKKACPICRTPIDSMDVDKALVMNRNIQDGVEAFKQVLLNHKKSANKQVDKTSPPRRSKRRRQDCRSQTRKSELAYCDEYSHEDENDVIEVNDTEDDEEDGIQKKMNSRNYGSMKKRDLQTLCKKYDIPTNGNEQELRDRMRKFQSMWNAEVDSIKPRTPSALAATLRREEKAQRDEKKLAMINGAAGDMKCMEKLSESIKQGNFATSGNANFDKKIKSNFDSMVAQLRNQRKKNRGTTSPNSPSNKAHSSSVETTLVTEAVVTEAEMPVTVSLSTGETDASLYVKPCHSTNSSTPRDYNPVEMPMVTPNTTTSQSPTSSISKLKEATIVQRSSRKQRSRNTRKRSASPSSSTHRSNWACSTCTYVNVGLDFFCKMCRQRK